jgi:hypothetical protein
VGVGVAQDREGGLHGAQELSRVRRGAVGNVFGAASVISKAAISSLSLGTLAERIRAVHVPNV